MASGVYTQSFGTKTRRNEQISPDPSHPIYRRLKPRSTLGVLPYVGRKPLKSSLHASSEELECEACHASLYAGRTLVRWAYFG